jgi:hypothetical protein
MFAAAVPSDAGESPPTRDIHSLCASDAIAGVQLCQQLAPGDPSACAEVCLQDYRVAHLAPAVATPVLAAPLDAAAPLKEPTPADPFTLALGDCVRRVREAEDVAHPVCRFFRPLDQMDFGQKHCDAKCAELTEGYRASRAAAKGGAH